MGLPASLTRLLRPKPKERWSKRQTHRQAGQSASKEREGEHFTLSTPDSNYASSWRSVRERLHLCGLFECHDNANEWSVLCRDAASACRCVKPKGSILDR